MIGKGGICTWKLDDDPDYSVWKTECDNLFMFEADGPVENRFKYCPYCGGGLSGESVQPGQSDE